MQASNLPRAAPEAKRVGTLRCHHARSVRPPPREMSRQGNRHERRQASLVDGSTTQRTRSSRRASAAYSRVNRVNPLARCPCAAGAARSVTATRRRSTPSERAASTAAASPAEGVVPTAASGARRRAAAEASCGAFDGTDAAALDRPVLPRAPLEPCAASSATRPNGGTVNRSSPSRAERNGCAGGESPLATAAARRWTGTHHQHATEAMWSSAHAMRIFRRGASRRGHAALSLPRAAPRQQAKSASTGCTRVQARQRFAPRRAWPLAVRRQAQASTTRAARRHNTAPRAEASPTSHDLDVIHPPRVPRRPAAGAPSAWRPPRWCAVLHPARGRP